MAVEQQASEALERWFKFAEEGKNEEAFLMTANVMSEKGAMRPGQSDTRSIIETRFNTSPGESLMPGAYSYMQEMDYYRYIQQGGDQTKTKLLRIEDWGLKDGRYRVRLRYQVDTPAVSFELSQLVEGIWPPNSPRRLWFISTYAQDSYRPDGAYLKFTDQGKQVIENWSERPQTGARSFLQSWVQTLAKGEPYNTFLGTLPTPRKEFLGQTQGSGFETLRQYIWRQPRSALFEAGIRRLAHGQNRARRREGVLLRR